MFGTRYSGTRMEGARNTACTKLTDEDKEALHLLAVEAGMSDYELTRKILRRYIRVWGDAPADAQQRYIQVTDCVDPSNRDPGRSTLQIPGGAGADGAHPE